MGNGTLQPGDQLELPRLLNNVLAAVSGMSRIAELLLEPRGQIRWAAGGEIYSISRPCADTHERFAPKNTPSQKSLNGLLYWSRKGDKIPLADLASTLPELLNSYPAGVARLDSGIWP